MPFGGLLTVGLIGAGSSIFGGILGSNAANTAAQQQQQALQQGINVSGVNTQSALNALQGGQAYNQALYTPYMQAGTQGIGSLSQALGPGGSLAQGWNQQFQAPTAAQAAAIPGYQFALQQGLGAIQSSAAAGGNLLTGGTMKALNNYAQNMASTNYQQTYNNAFQNYLQNYNQFQQNQANQYSRLMGLTQLGMGATGQMGNVAMGAAGTAANIYGQNTATLANLLGAQGQARASGTVGAANAWQGALGNVGNLASTLYGFNKLFPSGGGGGGAGLTAGDLSTAGNISTGLGGIGSFTGVCWVAAELYGGWHEPRTEIVRQWMLAHPAVLAIYKRVGPSLASLIRRNRMVRSIVKPLFDAIVKWELIQHF